MTVAVVPHGDQLAIGLAGWDAVYALRKRITVPLASVRRVRLALVRHLVPERPPLASPGTVVPDALAIGAFRSVGDDTAEFWCVRTSEWVVDIELATDGAADPADGPTSGSAGGPTGGLADGPALESAEEGVVRPKYRRLVLEVVDPGAVVAELAPLISAAGANA